MAGLVDIFNLALSATGTKKLVSGPTEQSREAEICNLWYESVRDQILRAAYWPTAKGNARLALLVERDVDEDWLATDPDPGWQYAYAAPSDMIAPRFMSDYTRFELTTLGNSLAIVTGMEDAVLTYTKRQTIVDLWDVSLKMAIVYGLAAHIAIPLHGKNDRAELMENRANNLILQARQQNANVNEAAVESIPDWLSARGSAFNTPATRFIYPYGPMIAITSGVGVT